MLQLLRMFFGCSLCLIFWNWEQKIDKMIKWIIEGLVAALFSRSAGRFWRDWGFFNDYFCECAYFFDKCFRNSTKFSICFSTTSHSSLERSQSISSSNKSNKIPLILINFISKISSLSYIISKRNNQGSFLCSKTYFMLPDFLWNSSKRQIKATKANTSQYKNSPRKNYSYILKICEIYTIDINHVVVTYILRMSNGIKNAENIRIEQKSEP